MDYNFLLNAWKEYDKFKAILSASAFLKMLLHRETELHLYAWTLSLILKIPTSRLRGISFPLFSANYECTAF
jgi:hypothetical protein